MENALSMVTKDQPNQKTREDDPKLWRERALSEEELFHGTDEVGRTGWFLQLSISGLYPRRIGPFSSKEEALELLEDFLYEVTLGPLLDDVENNGSSRS